MRRLIRYELKKLMPARRAAITLLALAILCAAIFAADASLNGERYERERDFLGQYAGSVKQGDVARAVSRHAELLAKLPAGLTPDELREFEALEPVLNLNRCDEVRKTALAGEGIAAETLVVGQTVSYGVTESFTRTCVPLIMGFLIPLFVSPAFTQEYEVKADGILLASSKGRREAARAKLVAAFVVTTGLYAFTAGFYALFATVVWGPSDPRASFVFTGANVFGYLNSPFSFTVLEYGLVSAATSLAGCFALCAFVLFLSAALRRTVWACMLGTVWAYLPFLAYLALDKERGRAADALRFAYSQIMSVRTLFAVNSTLDVGFAKLPIAYLSLCAAAVSATAFVLLALRRFAWRQAEN